MTSECTIRQVKPQDPDYFSILHLALDVAPPSRAQHHRGVVDLLAHAERTGSPIELAFGAYLNGTIHGAAIALEAPGGSALTFASSGDKSHIGFRGASAALRELSSAAWRRSNRILEGLLHPNRSNSRDIYAQAEFRLVTQLRYMLRDGPKSPPKCQMAGDLRWESFTPELESLFVAALEASYVQSLDCPELTGLRPTADVLAGHMASGDFDAALWWVATRNLKPVGVILLNRFPQRDALELAYMGVAQASRGKGVANALLNRAVAVAGSLGATCMALAVDSRNTPALRMYSRWGFLENMSREAWIATSPLVTRGCGDSVTTGEIAHSFPHSQQMGSRDGA